MHNEDKALLAFDLKYSVDPSAQMWILSLINSMAEDGFEIYFVARELQCERFEATLSNAGVTVIPTPTDLPLSAFDETGILPKHQAKRICDLGQSLGSSLTLIQGAELCFRVSSSPKSPNNLWSVLEDSPVIPRVQKFNASQAQIVGGASRILLASSDSVRGNIEALAPSTSSKTRLLPHFYIDDSLSEDRAPRREGDPTYVIDYSVIGPILGTVNFEDYIAKAQISRKIPRILFTNFKKAAEADDSYVKSEELLNTIPGAIIDPSPLNKTNHLTSEAYLLLPDTAPNLNQELLARLARANDMGLLRFDSLSPDFAGNSFIGEPFEIDTSNRKRSFRDYFPTEFPDFEQNPLNKANTKVLLAGADFKFAGDLIDSLWQRPDIDLKVDLFESNSHPQPAKSTPLLRWADVIIAEFASFNAIWYSQNKLPHQKLIVHLHGYEVLQDWIDELDIARVDKIVVASNFYREKVLELKGWPSDKVTVIANTINTSDLDRPKYDDARFHIGMVGLVPILKRPDRALDLLECLLKHDDRYVLHFKGHQPWNYSWEWKKAAHQDAYRAFYARLGQRPELLKSVVFEPFTPDIANWFRKVGWILSPSYRETFHMAAVEGGVSGAVPLVWEREGSVDIIGEDFNFKTTEEIAEFVLENNKNATDYSHASLKAKRQLSRYSLVKVRKEWLDLIFALPTGDSHRFSEPESKRVISSLNYAEQALYDRTTAAIEANDTEAALQELNEGIKLTAGKTGPLKDLELYVRGLAAADEKRFNHFLPSSALLDSSRPLVVRQSNIGNSARWLSETGLDRLLIDVVLPKHLNPFNQLTLSKDDIQIDKAYDIVNTDVDLRFDRWLDFTKCSIIEKAVSDRVDTIIVAGSWQVALAAAKAADELATKMVWQIDKRTIDLLSTDELFIDSADSEYQLAKAAFNRANVRLVPDSVEEIPLSLVDDVTAILSDSATSRYGLPVIQPKQVFKLTQSTSSDRAVGLGNSLQYRLSMESLTVAAIGSKDFLDELRGLVKEVIEIPTRGYFEAISSFVDVLIVDSTGNEDGEWKGRVQYSKESGRYTITKIFDHARLLGVPSLFLQRDNNTMAPHFVAGARKADCIGLSLLQGLPAVLALNPLASSSATLWMNTQSFEFNFSSALRAMGVPVELRARSSSEINQIAEVAPYDEPESDHPSLLDEKISVVLATYNGSENIGTMLDSIAQQSLPANLIELLVIENGKRSETEQIIQRFAQNNPMMHVEYTFEETPNVGNARNVGIQRARGKFVTFVDDDDFLEPNYLLSMWLSAADDSLVIGLLADQDLEGGRNISTPNNNRIAALNEGRQPLTNRAGLLGLNACKLIPTRMAKQLAYDTDLKSGEDTVFMSQLLGFKELQLVPCAPMENAMYIRILRENSVSRQDETFEFCVEQRIRVINRLIEIRNQLGKSTIAALNYLIDNQSSFIRKFQSANPDRLREVKEYINTYCADPEAIRL